MLPCTFKDRESSQKFKVVKFSFTCLSVSNLKDVNCGEFRIENTKEDKYLGDIITSDGKNTKNILARRAKGMGIIDQISSMLTEICFGPYQLEVALHFRNSLLLNGFLTNSEAWYGVTSQEITYLEQVDELYLRKILEVPSSSPKCMLYLEFGILPIRFVIKSRRLMFLQCILKEEPDSVISQFFHAQDSNPTTNDWAVTVRQDLEELELNLNFDEIERLSKEQFKTKVSKAMSKIALKYLLKEKNKGGGEGGDRGKVAHIQFKQLKIQEYLEPNTTSIRMSKFIYHARSRMLDLKVNFKNRKHQDLLCPICLAPDSIDSQEHLLLCPSLTDTVIVNRKEVPKYRDLFCNDVKKQIAVASVLEKRFMKRKELLKNQT